MCGSVLRVVVGISLGARKREWAAGPVEAARVKIHDASSGFSDDLFLYDFLAVLPLDHSFPCPDGPHSPDIAACLYVAYSSYRRRALRGP
jgi:hypothetical protein